MFHTLHSLALLSVLFTFWGYCTWAQVLLERDGVCSEEGCYVVYFQRRTFLESWRSCKAHGGTLATLKRAEEEAQIRELLSGVELRGGRRKVRLWIGLQRQPRQCAVAHPLRGFSWTTGYQDTEYTNWLTGDSGSCSVPRCVFMSYSIEAHERHNNYKWLDSPCSERVEGFLCSYSYKAMCPSITAEGHKAPIYNTPFELESPWLTHVPLDSMATITCPVDTRPDQKVQCVLREDGSAGWSKEFPFCYEPPAKTWCEEDNGGCQHYCHTVDSHYYCECYEGYQLGGDGQSCTPDDPCEDDPCDYNCVASTEGYRCTCPEGFLLAPDTHNCVDEDECLQSPCPQECVNTEGSFVCSCSEGYQAESGQCVDIDECLEFPCDHACENIPGSYVCYCRIGFAPMPDQPDHCQDIDECQFPDSCQQMCVNDEGSFECHCEENYVLQPDHYSCEPLVEDGQPTTTMLSFFPWTTSNQYGWFDPITDWFVQDTTENMVTDTPSPKMLPTISTWLTYPPEEDPITDSDPGWVIDDNHPDRDIPNSLIPNQFAVTMEPKPTTPTTDVLEDESSASTSAPSTNTTKGASQDIMRPNPGASEERAGKGNMVKNNLISPGDPQSEMENTGDKKSLGEMSVTMFEGSISSKGKTTTLPPRSNLTSTLQGNTVPFENDGMQQQDNSWILWAVLIPLVIFLLVLVILGVVYCIRCRATRPPKENSPKCYYWISGSADNTKTAV